MYLANRSFWLDEGALYGNLKGVAIFDFSNHLQGDQLAPFGFLIVERLLVRLGAVPAMSYGSFRWCVGSLRSGCSGRWPCVAGVRLGLVALALFAASDNLIYYSSELSRTRATCS